MLRAGVIGAGVFGGYHARQYASLPGVSLAGVYDPLRPAAEALTGAVGGEAFESLEALLAACDVVSVASPASNHAEAALTALAAGRAVYVEKPLAIGLDDVEKIRALADARGLVVAVGHQERVIFEAIGLTDIPEPPLRLEALRHGPPSERSLDVSVVLDLMVHDLDLALTLVAAEPVAAEGEGTFSPDGRLDAAQAETDFEGGFTARFDVSRLAPARRRVMKLIYASGEVEIDFVARTFRNSTPHRLYEDFAETPAARDPLKASLAAFLAAVRGEAPRPLVTAAEAIRALDLALAVERALGLG